MIRLLAAAGAAIALALGGAAPVPHLGRVVVIVFENKEAGEITARSAPTFAAIARKGAILSGYRGVAHPSLPNYLDLVSGSAHGIHSDCTNCSVSAPNLADTIEASGRTWKTYAEGYPDSPRYAKKHNPLLYFADVASRPDRLARVVPLTRFSTDLHGGGLPDFSLVVPDLCNDMHSCPIAAGDRWLASFLPPLLASSSLVRGVVFVVFDEGKTSVGGGGEVAAFAVGPAIRPGSRSSGTTSHFGLLRTIEDGWSLPKLGQSASARPLTGIWSIPRKG